MLRRGAAPVKLGNFDHPAPAMLSRRTTSRCFLASLPAWLAPSLALAWQFEMARVDVDETLTVAAWTQVSFLAPFETPPLVFVLPTSDGDDPATLRVRNVTSTGFEVTPHEASATDGPHSAMPTAYLAIVPGTHTMPDGTRVTALRHTTSSSISRLLGTSWDTIALPGGFTSPPAVLATIQSVRNEERNPPASTSAPFLAAAIRNVGSGTLQISLERAETTDGSIVSTEDIAVLAIDANTTSSFVDRFNNSATLATLRTGNNIRGRNNGCFTTAYGGTFAATPLAVAAMNTRNGNNGGWLRRCSESSAALGLHVEEDIDNDSERNHINEVAGIVAASRDFHVNFAVDVSVLKNVRSLSDPVAGTANPRSIPAAIMEYTIEVENRGSASPDTDTLVVTDEIPPEVALCVTAACYPGGPVVLDTAASPVPPGVSLLLVEYSDDGGASFGYTPAPDAAGFDGRIDSVRITLGGSLASVAPGGVPSFVLRLATRVE